MKDESEPVEFDPSEMARRIQSGEYFREAQTAYDLAYHDIMSERYLYIVITAVALLFSLLAMVAAFLLLPLKTEKMYIYYTADIVNDMPSIKRLGERGEDPNKLLKEYLSGQYVKLREEYDPDLLDRNASGVKAHSTDEVFRSYQQALDPSNPQSPIVQFQRLAVRKVEILSYRMLADNQMQVAYNAVIQSNAGVKKIPMRANITFSFDDIQVDQTTGETSKLKYLVSEYQSAPA